MEFRLLGPLEVSDKGAPIPLGGPKQRTLLALLVLNANRVVGADRMIDDVWGEDPPVAARNVVQTYASRLRKALGPRRLEGRSGGYVLNADPSEIDALRFAALAEQARGVDDPRVASRLYREALEVWRGGPLADLAGQAALRPEITRLEELWMAAVEGRIEADLALGRHADLVGEIERLASAHPLRERLRAHLMLALYRSGRQAEALEAYHEARRCLVEELGIEPGSELRELEQAILRQDPSLDLPPVPTRSEKGVPHNLPAELTSFVGREGEIDEIGALLERARLITLTGPGGSGKTRLALRVASGVAPRFPDGAFLVPLAALRDMSLIAPTIAKALDVKERPDEPVETTLRDHLARREMLLVLDNFEQLAEGAPVATRLLEAAPGVRALVTSRAVLRLSGEHEFPVPPLEVPDPGALPSVEDLAKLDAVALFVQRARMADPRFRMTEESAPPIASICRRLDGLPLAIELAASMVRRFEPEALLAQLGDALSLLTEGPRDVPARQQTLRDAIAWSYDLLSEAERHLFRALGIFLRGSTIGTAREVVDPDRTLSIDLGDGMRSLASKSLLVAPPLDGEPRFRMLETIRDFARTELVERGELADLAWRHARFFLGLAEEAEPQLLGEDQAGWLDRLEQEHDNLRAALRWSVETGATETGMRLAAALWRFWLLRGHLREGRGWLERALSVPGAEGPSAHRGKALTALGGLAYWQGDYGAAGRAYRESLGLSQDLGDTANEGAALYNVGFIVLIEGDLDEAWDLFTAAREIHRRLDDRSSYAYAGLGLGLVAVRRGDFAAAAEIHGETVTVFRELGDRFGLGSTLTALARPHREKGDFDKAEEAIQEALTSYRKAGDLGGIAMVLGAIADVRTAHGDLETGVRLGGAAHSIEEELGGGAPAGVRTYEDPRNLAAGHLEPEAIARAWDAGRSLSVEEAVALMLESGP